MVGWFVGWLDGRIVGWLVGLERTISRPRLTNFVLIYEYCVPFFSREKKMYENLIINPMNELLSSFMYETVVNPLLFLQIACLLFIHFLTLKEQGNLYFSISIRMRALL